MMIFLKIMFSIVEMTIYTYILAKISGCNSDKKFKISLLNAYMIMICGYMYASELGAVYLIVANIINGLIIFGIDIKKSIKTTLIFIFVSVLVQSIIFFIYSSLIDYDGGILVIPTLISIYIEYLILFKTFKLRRKDMTILMWIGDKKKRSLKEYKKSVKK